MKKKIIIVLFAVLMGGFLCLYVLPVAYLYAAYVWTYRSPPTGCQDVPFEAYKKGAEVSCTVNVKRDDCYTLYLNYEGYNEHQNDLRKKYFSPFFKEKNLLKLNLDIYNESNESFLNKSIMPPPVSVSYSSDLYSKRFSRGKYIVKLKSLEHINAYKDVPMSITFKFCPKG